MTPTFPWRPTALIACATMTASCAGSLPTSPVAPPRLTLPALASRPCDVYRLPADPTLSDLETGYMTRGRQIADCDLARQMAVDTLVAEREAIQPGRRPVRPLFRGF